ncbi:MAG: VOC family protein, partial [Gemmatimonadetes bacterium]|nr:VOC family protein [Gemmatimonadota bacterium]
WERHNAEIYMTTRPLDLRSLLAAADLAESRSVGLPGGTRIGHVHLEVSDLAAAESFYAGLLGFDVTNRSYPGAMFFGAGGYHHHIGTNTWESRGGAALSSRAMGLIDFTLELSGRAAVDSLRQQLEQAGWDTWDADGGWCTRDRDGIAIQVRLKQEMPAGR